MSEISDGAGRRLAPDTDLDTGSIVPRKEIIGRMESENIKLIMTEFVKSKIC